MGDQDQGDDAIEKNDASSILKHSIRSNVCAQIFYPLPKSEKCNLAHPYVACPIPLRHFLPILHWYHFPRATNTFSNETKPGLRHNELAQIGSHSVRLPSEAHPISSTSSSFIWCLYVGFVFCQLSSMYPSWCTTRHGHLERPFSSMPSMPALDYS